MLHSFYFKIVFFSLLSILSIVTHVCVDRYSEAGEQLLVNSDFSKGAQGWEIKTPNKARVVIGSGVVRIQSSDYKVSPNISQKFSADSLGGAVVLKVTAKSANISKGEQLWQTGRILFLQYRHGTPIFQTSHVLALFEGTVDWKEYSKVFHIQRGISEARVIIHLNRATGELYSKDVSLFQVTANPIFAIAKWTLMAVWFVFAIILFSSLLSAPDVREWLKPTLTIMAIVCIVIGTTIPGALKNNFKSDVMKEANNYSETISAPAIDATKTSAGKVNSSKSAIDITKWAHFGLFGLLTFLLLWQSVHLNPYMILISVLMLACGTEVVQLFIEERGPTFSDVLIDMGGSIAGLLLWLFVRRYWDRTLAAEETGS